MHNSMATVSFLILTGGIQHGLALAPGQALEIINSTVQWNRAIRGSLDWMPAEGDIQYPISALRYES